MVYAQSNRRTTHTNCVSKVILWELCKEFRFNQTKQWYMHNPTEEGHTETAWVKWSAGNCARNLDLTKRNNGICTIQQKNDTHKLCG